MTTAHGERTRPATVWSILVAGLAVLLALAAIALAVTGVAVGTESGSMPWKLVLLPAVWVVPGVLVALGRPSNPLGWLMLAIATVFATSAFATQWVESGERTGAAWAVWFADRFSAIVVPIGLLTLLLLPSGRLPTRHWRPAAVVVIAVQVGLVGAWSLPQGPAAAPDTDFPPDVASYPNPVGLLPGSVTGYVSGLDTWLLQVPLLLGVVAVVARLRRRDGDDRERLVGVLGAVAVFAILAVIGRQLWPSAADTLDVVGSALLAAALCSAVFRRRLHGVDLVVHHALVYTTLTAGVAVAYVATVGLLGQVEQSLSPFGVGAVTAAIALALLPLRTRLQRLVDRAMYGDTRTPGRTVLRLVQTVAGSSSLDAVMSGLARTATTSLRAPWASVVVGAYRADHGERPPTGASRAATLRAGDQILGTLTVVLRPHRTFGDREVAALAELANHGGQAVRAVQTADELLASRQQLVTAREEERSRLRRDLHDELGPTLASLSMQLAGLAHLIQTDPVTAAERAPRLGAAAQEALDHVRRTARGLRPPALDELGLVGALKQAAHDIGVAVEEEVDVPQLSPAVEVAAYRIGVEALTNVARHANDKRAALRMMADSTELILRVVDHGRGSAEATVGVGVLSMRERAEELGGTVTIRETPGGGTTVEARLPVVTTDRLPR